MSDSKKPSLPHGWVVHQSNSFPDRVYYFNIRTGVSSWECPELISKADSSQNLPPTPPALLLDPSIVFPSRHSSRKTEEQTVKPVKPKHLPPHAIFDAKATSPPCVSSSSEVNDITKPPVSKRLKPAPSPMGRRKIKRPVVAPTDDSASGTKNSVRYKPYATGAKKNEAEMSFSALMRLAKDQQRYAVKKKCSPSVQPPVAKKSSPAAATSLSVSKARQLEKDLHAVAKRKERFSLPSSSAGKKQSPSKTTKSLPSTPSTSGNQIKHSVTDVSSHLPDCSTDVEMLDLSTDCIDPSSSKCYHIVLDTNVLISNLKLLDELKDTPLEGCGPPLIIVPWVVLQELDGIKTSSGDKAQKANKAVRYIHGMLSVKHPRFCGQSSLENPRELEGSLNPSCNDDMILNCCLQMIKKVPREKVILLSNDKNLCNKAMVHQVQAYTSDTLFQNLKVDFSPVKSAPAFAMSCNVSVSNELTESEERLRLEVDRIMMLTKSLLKTCLGEFLETEMIVAYKGDMWLSVVHLKPPWSLLDILECIIKHWTAVFNFVVGKRTKKCIQNMYDALKSAKGYICDEEEALDFVANGLSLCTTIGARGATSAKETVEKLIPLQQQLQCLGKNNAHEGSDNKRSSGGQTQSLPSEDHAVPHNFTIESNTRVKQVFQHVWAILNHLCGTVLDALGWPHKLEYQRPPTLPSKEETDKFIPVLYPELQKLRKHMIEVLSVKNENRLENIKSFYKQLLSVLPSLNVHQPFPVSMAEDEFRGFCTNSENKEILQAGLKHLNHIFTLVHKSIVGTAKQQ